MSPDLIFILFIGIPLGIMVWVSAIFLILMLIDIGPGIIEDAVNRWKNRE